MCLRGQQRSAGECFTQVNSLQSFMCTVQTADYQSVNQSVSRWHRVENACQTGRRAISNTGLSKFYFPLLARHVNKTGNSASKFLHGSLTQHQHVYYIKYDVCILSFSNICNFNAMSIHLHTYSSQFSNTLLYIRGSKQ